MTVKIIPIILAGGAGTRLWPLSRETFPKQFLRLISRHSLLQETVLRVHSLMNILPPLIICNVDHYFMSQDHLAEIGVSERQFILEPFGKNTAPAIACAAQYATENMKGNSLLLVLPSDHYIADPELFFAAIEHAKAPAEQGALVTFGVVPTHPETGYGYIKAGEVLSPHGYRVERFIEKPQLESAQQFLATGGFFWNSGMFLFKPEAYLEELKKWCPDAYRTAQQSWLNAEKKEDYWRLPQQEFADCPNISIDYAVMEKTAKAVVVPLAAAWNDLGCWAAVAKSGECDANRNVIKGEALAYHSEDCFISVDSPQMVAALGLRNQIVVATPDVVLVADKAYSQDVKHLVQQLKSRHHHLTVHHRKQHSAAGSIESLATAQHFEVEHFTVKAKGNLIVAACRYPTYWLVTNGEARISDTTVTAAQGHYVDQQKICRITNPGDQELHIIRVLLKSIVVEDEVAIS
jgi:mannose-1-phosphate guanylyltransferase / mannose-6-phosphate isomerase